MHQSVINVFNSTGENRLRRAPPALPSRRGGRRYPQAACPGRANAPRSRTSTSAGTIRIEPSIAARSPKSRPKYATCRRYSSHGTGASIGVLPGDRLKTMGASRFLDGQPHPGDLVGVVRPAHVVDLHEVHPPSLHTTNNRSRSTPALPACSCPRRVSRPTKGMHPLGSLCPSRGNGFPYRRVAVDGRPWDSPLDMQPEFQPLAVHI